jgi:hypothetical protein
VWKYAVFAHPVYISQLIILISPGTIKDVTGSFVYVVIAINVLTMITAAVWLSKDLFCKEKPKESS